MTDHHSFLGRLSDPEGLSLQQVPHFSRDLIAWLDRTHPPRCIEAGQSPEEAHRYAGARDLIDHLRTLQDEEDYANASEE